MLRKSLFALITFQFLTGFVYALSFLGTPIATNETEKQLIDLFTNYKQDLGAGFKRSTFELFTGLSACFTLICILGGWVNLYFLKKKLDSSLFRGLLFIEMVVFGVVFTLMILFTFLPLIVLSGLIFSGCVMAWHYSSRDSLT
jgi:hypothetical protein